MEKLAGGKRINHNKAKEILHTVCRDHDIEPCSLGIGPRSDTGGWAYFSVDAKGRKVVYMTQKTIRVFTLLHEIAHYFVWIKFGKQEDPHNHIWYNECQSLFDRYTIGGKT